MSRSDSAIIEARDIRHRFARDGPPVLGGVSLALRGGEFVAVVGSSGCGKTTLLSILAGLTNPVEGSVWLNGEDVTGAPSRTRALVFQSDRLFPWRTALRNVTLGLEFRRERRGAAQERALGALRLVGLGENAHAYPRELSGGMRQRVNVARALVMDPDFLLMDEPFAALDAQNREMMQLELLRIWSSTNIGVVFVTHQIEEALYLADRVAVMVAGPGLVRKDVAVPFDRPRDLRIKRTPEFQELYDEIWSEIEYDVRKGAAADRDARLPTSD